MFGEARADCVRLLGDFDFLCDIVDGFLPLCNIARGAFTDTALEKRLTTHDHVQSFQFIHKTHRSILSLFTSLKSEGFLVQCMLGSFSNVHQTFSRLIL